MSLGIFSNGKGKDIDPEFETKWEDYKATQTSLKELESTIKNHLEVTKKYVASCAQLSIQIAHFFTTSEDDVCVRTRSYGTANAEIERIQLTSVQKLYEDEVLQPLNILWNVDEELHRSVKKRKELIKVKSKKEKAWKDKLNEKTGIEDEIRKEKESGRVHKRFISKRKSISEVNREVTEKKRELEEAKEKQKAITELIIRKFDSLELNKRQGTLLASPIAGIIACQHHLALKVKEKMDPVRSLFTEQQVYSRTLRKYDAQQVKGPLIDGTAEVISATGFVFGRMLTSPTPGIVCDCVTYIRQGLKAEGLFRIPGNRGHVEEIRKNYDSNEMDILNTREDIDIHDVCSTLKLYLNSLPEPLIPFTAYEELEKHFESYTGSGAEKQKIISIIKRVATPQKGLIGYILNFLYDIAKMKKYNQMKPSNLATCFAPVLMRPRPGSKSKDNKQRTQMTNLKNVGANIATMNILIENARSFGVPPQAMVDKALNLTPETLARVQRNYMHAGSQHQKTQEENQSQMLSSFQSLPQPQSYTAPSNPISVSSDLELSASFERDGKRGGQTFDPKLINDMVGGEKEDNIMRRNLNEVDVITRQSTVGPPPPPRKTIRKTPEGM